MELIRHQQDPPVENPVCRCPGCDPDDPDWTPPIHDIVQHALKCPKHRPVKQYCRIHYTGFYGHCHQCQLEDQPVVVHVQDNHDDEIEHLKAQKDVIDSAIEDLS